MRGFGLTQTFADPVQNRNMVSYLEAFRCLKAQISFLTISST